MRRPPSSHARPCLASSPVSSSPAVALVTLLLLAALPTASLAAWPAADRAERGGVATPDDFRRAPATKLLVSDPTGDVFGPAGFDLASLEARLVDDELTVVATFADPVGAPGTEGGVSGFVDLDTDRDGTTGDEPFTDFFRDELGVGGSTGMGNEAYVDLFTYDAADGAADLVDDSDESLIARIPVAVGADSLTFTIDVALLGGTDGVDVAAIFGTVDEPADLAPNAGSVAAVEGGTILLQGGRFLLDVYWRTAKGEEGVAEEVVAVDDSVVLEFFGPENWEILAKVLDGCPVNDHWWVFYSGATAVGFDLTVTDTLTGARKTYSSPIGQATVALNDTAAFPCQ